jgi:PleD family two-component response regulator
MVNLVTAASGAELAACHPRLEEGTLVCTQQTLQVRCDHFSSNAIEGLSAGDDVMSAGIIAVIDDNQTWIDTVSEVLADEGFEVRSATNEEAAIDLLDSVRAKLILLDVHIPGTSGLRILADFRGRDRTTPILVVSGDDRALIRNQAMSDGASGFLQKPVPTSILIRAVKRYVQRPPKEQTRERRPGSRRDRSNPSLN